MVLRFDYQAAADALPGLVAGLVRARILVVKIQQAALEVW